MEGGGARKWQSDFHLGLDWLNVQSLINNVTELRL